MAIRGTLKVITPRWLLAAPGLLVAASLRIVAAAGVLRRIAPRIAMVGAITVPGRRRRRLIASAVSACLAIVAPARRRRRAIADAIRISALISAIARRRRRVQPTAQAQLAINVPTGARAYGPFRFANGTRVKLNGVSAKIIR